MLPRRSLGVAGRGFWDATVEWADPEAFGHVEAELLLQACETLDLIDVLSDDSSVSGAREVRQQRLALVRLLDKLGLPYDEERQMSPAQKRASRAARSRWDAPGARRSE